MKVKGSPICGIFGSILHSGRKRQDLGVLRALTLANRARGKESLGFFNGEFEVSKSGTDPLDYLQTAECTEWLKASQTSQFLVGHTRFSTRGTVCDANSHPFTYGDVVGSHNGIIDAPPEYSVDSEYAIDLMDKFDSDFHKGLKDEFGYWTLSWFDRRDGYLYLTVHDNTCGLVDHDGAWYFSSDPEHLAACVGAKEMFIFEQGNSCRFSPTGELEWLPKFESDINYGYKQDWRTGGSGGDTVYSCYNGNTKKSSSSSSSSSSNNNNNNNTTTLGTVGNVVGGGLSTIGGYPGDGLFPHQEESEKWVNLNDPNGIVKDYDQEFRDMWSEYEHQYEEI